MLRKIIEIIKQLVCNAEKLVKKKLIVYLNYIVMHLVIEKIFMVFFANIVKLLKWLVFKSCIVVNFNEEKFLKFIVESFIEISYYTLIVISVLCITKFTCISLILFLTGFLNFILELVENICIKVLIGMIFQKVILLPLFKMLIEYKCFYKLLCKITNL